MIQNTLPDSQDVVIRRNTIYNEDCFATMERMPIGLCDIILTSPFYNTNKKQGKSVTIGNQKAGYSYVRYDSVIDNMTDDEYSDFTERLFVEFDRILNLGGVVLYNISYGSENRDGMFKAIYHIIENTPFTIADVIVWKKKSAFPNSCSPNKLTRITEFVFVFCRKGEELIFHANKPVTSERSTGQKAYGNVFNFIEAANNDENCPIHKATYSTELCGKLLNIYAKPHSLVYDPFMGTGTTAVACKKLGHDYIGSDISKAYCEWARDRLSKIQPTLFDGLE